MLRKLINWIKRLFRSKKPVEKKVLEKTAVKGKFKKKTACKGKK